MSEQSIQQEQVAALEQEIPQLKQTNNILKRILAGASSQLPITLTKAFDSREQQ